MPKNVYESFPYDAAYEFLSPALNIKKRGLFEIDLNTQRLRVYKTSENEFHRAYLLEDDERTADEIQEGPLNLALLPKLRLDFSPAKLMHIPVDTSKIPILLIHMVYFTRGNIVFRDGMTAIFAIDKVICENGDEDIVNVDEFQPRRCHHLKDGESNSLERFSNKDSIHNRLFSVFSFRCSLDNYFQTSLHNVRGQSKSANFIMDNVTSDSAYSLFSFLRDIFTSKDMVFHEDILIGSIDKESKKRIDLLYTPQNSDLGIAMMKLDQYHKASETIVVNVPFVEFLYGYLPVHFNLSPEKVDLQRRFTPSLEGLLFDHIPNDSIINFSYNSLCQTLQCKFNVSQNFYRDIASKKLFDPFLSEFINNLVGKAFYDPLFEWTIIVIKVEFNTNLFYADTSSKKSMRQGYFVAWSTRIENLKEKSYIDRLKNDKQIRETLALPYDPKYFDVSSMLHDLSSASEDEINDHKRLINQFYSASTIGKSDETSRRCNLQSTNQVTSDKKRKYSTPCSSHALSPVKQLSIQRRDTRTESGPNYRVNVERFMDLATSRMKTLDNDATVENISSESSEQVTTTDDGLSSHTSVVPDKKRANVGEKYRYTGERYFCNSMIKYMALQQEYYSKIVSDSDLTIIIEYLLRPFLIVDLKAALPNLFPGLVVGMGVKTMPDLTKCVKSYIIELKKEKEKEEVN